MPDTPVVANYTATDLNKTGGKVLDDASAGAVRIRRRGASYLLMREEHFSQLLDSARSGRPASLDDLLQDYDPDKIKTLTRPFLDNEPRGRERL